MKSLILSLFTIIIAQPLFAQMKATSQSYAVICDPSKPAVELKLSYPISMDRLDCTKDAHSGYIIFRLKEELQVTLGEVTYSAPKATAVFIPTSATSCQQINSDSMDSAFLMLSPTAVPALKYKMYFGSDGSVFISQSQVLSCVGQAN